MFKIDTKEFKKLYSEKGKTHMQHKDGHVLVVDHSKLDPKLREKLATLPGTSKPPKMAEGGEVKDKLDYEPFQPLDYERIPEKNPLVVEKIPSKKLDYERMANGGEVAGGHLPCKNPNCKSFGSAHPNCRCHGGMAKGGEVKDGFCSDSKMHNEGCEYYADGGNVEAKPDEFDDMVQTLTGTGRNTEAANQARFEAEQASLPQTPEVPLQPTPEPTPVQPTPSDMAPAAPQAPVAQQSLVPQTAPEQPQTGMPSYGSTINQGYQQGVQAAKLQEIADKQIGRDRAKALQDNSTALADSQKAFQSHVQNVAQELKHFHDDLSTGKTDIDKYWDSHSKLASGIGLILAGFNPTSRPNAAAEYLNKQIDRSVENQVKRRGQLFESINSELHNAQAAAEMTRLYYATDLTNKLELAAAKHADPAAKARALDAISKLTMQYAPQIMKVSAMTAPVPKDPAAFAAHNKNLRFQGFKDIADSNEAHRVAGIGDSNTGPVPEPMRERLIKQATLINATKELRDAISKAGPLDRLNPNVRAALSAKAAELQQMYRQGVGASTSEQEQKMIDNNIISIDPGQLIKRWNVDPKLKALQESMISSHNVTRKMNGLELMEQDKEPAQIQPGVEYKKVMVNGRAVMRPVGRK